MSWNPTQYLAFADHRLRPVVDLLNRVPTQDARLVVDLGCGAGNATKFLCAAWPKAEIIGVDSSPEMLQRARDEDPGVDWVEADITKWQPPRPVSVLFSNAALHWLDGHEALIPKLAGHVEPGGCLALQMPANFRAPSHTTIEDIADKGPWRDAIVPLIKEPPTKEPGLYYDLLAPLSESLDIWHIEYLQVLQGDNPVVEFTKGSWLKFFLDALEEPERTAFEDAYRARIREAYPPRADGTTLFPFRRLFIVAALAGAGAS